MVKKIVFLGILVCLAGVSAFSNDPMIPDMIDRLRTAIEKGDIDRIELVCVPPEVAVRADLDAQMLAAQSYYKITVTKARAAHLMNPIWRELSATTTTEGGAIDLRWGVTFYDAKGNTITAFYFAGLGEHGRIGSIPVIFTKRSKRWIESQFAAFLH